MACIYCITNKINGKLYIGKSIKTAEERFREHVRDSRKLRCLNRPLYKAFNKYGTDNFSIDTLELVQDVSILSEREEYWIKYKNTFHFGYNATKGGDGSILYDYKKVIDLYNSGMNCIDISRLLKCNSETIHNIVKSYGFEPRKGRPHRIDIFSKSGKYIRFFMGSAEAYYFIQSQSKELIREDTVTVNISRYCTKSRKTDCGYGYIWKYHNFMKNITDINYREIDKKSGYYLIKNIITEKLWYGEANNLKKKLIAIIDAANKGKIHTPLYQEMNKYGLEAYEVEFPETIPEGAVLIEEINNPPKEKPIQEGPRDCPFKYRVNENTVLEAYTQEDLNKLKKWWKCHD